MLLAGGTIFFKGRNGNYLLSDGSKLFTFGVLVYLSLWEKCISDHYVVLSSVFHSGGAWIFSHKGELVGCKNLKVKGILKCKGGPKFIFLRGVGTTKDAMLTF